MKEKDTEWTSSAYKWSGEPKGSGLAVMDVIPSPQSNGSEKYSSIQQ